MALSHLVIHNFRNLAQIELEPLVQGFNFFYGQNGSGKTSLLEAIYYLGHRRSFRSLNPSHLIRHFHDQFNLFCNANDHLGQKIPIGIERLQEGDFRVRIKGEDIATISELASYLPIRLINVHSHHLMEGSPHFRRKYLDWGAFYQKQEFQDHWFRFKRLLKQRNAALRMQASSSELLSWTEEFADSALAFHEARSAYWAELFPYLQAIVHESLAPLFDLKDLSMAYLPGWDQEQAYSEILRAALPKDRERGYTFYGPHRADLSFKINNILAKEVLSTGQQKLLVCGMILAQGAFLAKKTNKQPIYLIDDLPSELDLSSRRWLIHALAEQQAQIFVTAVEQETINGILAQLSSPVKMFHVKQGDIRER